MTDGFLLTLQFEHHRAGVYVGVGESFEFATVRAHREHRGERRDNFALEQSAFPSPAVHFYEHGDIHETEHLPFCVVKILSDFSHTAIIIFKAGF